MVSAVVSGLWMTGNGSLNAIGEAGTVGVALAGFSGLEMRLATLGLCLAFFGVVLRIRPY